MPHPPDLAQQTTDYLYLRGEWYVLSGPLYHLLTHYAKSSSHSTWIEVSWADASTGTLSTLQVSLQPIQLAGHDTLGRTGRAWVIGREWPYGPARLLKCLTQRQ